MVVCARGVLLAVAVWLSVAVSVNAEFPRPGSVEELLATPLSLTWEDQETVTFGELFQRIAQETGVTVRIDPAMVPLVAMVVEEATYQPGEVVRFPKRSSSPSDYVSSPIPSLTPVYSSNPACPQCQPSGQTLRSATYLQADVQYDPVSGEGLNSEAGVVGQVVLEDSPEPPPVPMSEAPPAASPEEEPVTEPGIHSLGKMEEVFLRSQIRTAPLSSTRGTVESVLRAATSQMATPFQMMEEIAGLPATYTHAYDWELLVQDQSVLITTRLEANLQKETRVYKLPRGSELDSEELAGVIRRTIRPWSWRSQVDEIIGKIEMKWPEGATFKIPEGLSIDLTGNGSPIQIAQPYQNPPGASPSPESTTTTNSVKVDPEASIKAMQAMGSLLSSSAIAFVHGLITSTEILHYADPPQGTIESLPGMLIISQSQGAHREIADLLEQIADATAPERDVALD